MSTLICLVFVDYFIHHGRMTAMTMTPTEKNVSPSNYQHLHDGSADDYEDKIVQEFSHLLEKSKQLFNGLR